MKLEVGMSFPVKGSRVPFVVHTIRGSMTRIVTADLKSEKWIRTDSLEILADQLKDAGYDCKPRETGQTPTDHDPMADLPPMTQETGKGA